MASAFQKTNDSLKTDRGFVSGWFLVAGLILLGFWTWWAFSVRVARYEVSDSARLEVAGAATTIEADVAGAVNASHLTLGQQVEVGQVLVELDDRDQQLAFKQEQIKRAELAPQLAAVRAQAQVEDTGRTDEERVLVYSKGSAEAQAKQARADAALAASEAQRAEKLRAAGLISEADLQQKQAAAEVKRLAADSLEQSARRLLPELQVRATDRTAKQRQIFADAAKLEADIASSSAELERLRFEIEKRKIRATVAGKLTECAVIHAGTHISEGQQIGVILPAGRVQMVADFDPAAAFGKLHAGQRATVRLNGFPWAQFGVLQASVTRVAGEIRNGKVRVELALNDSNAKIPMQHGLPGSVEVEVERVTPVAMLLRSAGQTLGAH